VVEGRSSGVLAEAVPEIAARARRLLGGDRFDDLERRLTLREIDRAWSEHLAYAADLRESIHLHEVGGKEPIVEFSRSIVEPFDEISQHIDTAIVESFTSLDLSAMDDASQEIRGPSSTWTYLVNDTVFGSWVGLLGGRNVGLLASAAAFYAPLLVLFGLLTRWRKSRSLS